MEKIKAAIQKSKQNREHRNRTPAQGKLENRRRVDVGNGDHGIENITYDQTKTVALDPTHLENHRIIAQNKANPQTIRFDMLRTHVLHKMRENNWRTIAVTSPTAGCGKTVVALNLSLSLAKQTERTVLLADFDLRKPRVGPYLGLSQTSGLIDYIEGKVELGDAMINPGIPRFTVLANTVSIHNASETLSAARTRNLVSELRERYESRIVVFDLPPILETDDAMAFIPQVDCVLLVVANGQSTSSQVKKTMQLLGNSNIVSVVLNKSEENNDTSYSYY